MEWRNCKRILCIRPDNMGDLLMSSPAIRAIKETFACHVAVLVAASGAEAAQLLGAVDEVIECNLPWLKHENSQNAEATLALISTLKSKNYDACIVFNVYSQNPVPSLMLAYLAEIPLRAAYSRENLYGILTHWLPDPEPYHQLSHQVERDLALAKFIGATTNNDSIQIQLKPLQPLRQELATLRLEPKQYLILHPGVSEAKRSYPKALWIKLGQYLIGKYGLPLLLTGTEKEKELLQAIQQGIGYGAFVAPPLSLAALAWTIKEALALVAVNTGPVHLASATQTPVVVLYAQTNPQHHPWKVKSRVLEFSVDEASRSRNEVIRFVNARWYQKKLPYPTAEAIDQALQSLIGPIAPPVHIQSPRR